MNYMLKLPDHNVLLKNFRSCINWEEKYLYIIELGNHLSGTSKNRESQKHLIQGCQSTVWITITTINTKRKKDIVELYGDSDSAIIKGILCIIFIIYKGLTLEEIIHFSPYPLLNQIELHEHLTYSRSQGIKSILHVIHKQANLLYYTKLK